MIIHIFHEFLEYFDMNKCNRDETVKELLDDLRARINTEIEVVKKTMEIKGILEAIDY